MKDRKAAIVILCALIGLLFLDLYIVIDNIFTRLGIH